MHLCALFNTPDIALAMVPCQQTHGLSTQKGPVSFLKRIIKEAGPLTHEQNCLFPLRILFVNLCDYYLHSIEEAVSSLRRRVSSFKDSAGSQLQNDLGSCTRSRIPATPSLEIAFSRSRAAFKSHYLPWSSPQGCESYAWTWWSRWYSSL